MNIRIRSICFVLGLFASSLASAAGFRYSYAFESGYTFSGSFEGVANGNLVTDLVNVTAFMNGVPLNDGRSMVASGYLEGTGSAVAAIASFDGKQNHFIFVDANYPFGTSITDFFALLPFDIPSGFLETRNASAMVGDILISEFPGGAHEYHPARWSLAPIPEPDMYAFMLIGLLTVAVRAGRRKQNRNAVSWNHTVRPSLRNA